MEQFADIRPFHDDEVRGVLDRLIEDEEFLAAVSRLKFKRSAGAFGWLLRPLVRRALTKELAHVVDVRGFQLVIERYMTSMIEESTAGLSVSGLDKLAPDQPYLFISNHRDITLDPAFTNYALHHHGFQTVRIAIGDNLLTKPYVSDLMRLNKSFIVRRSAKGPREMLRAYRELSAYIRHSIFEDRAPIWIAQREGRAKDGVDRTEPAIIKMLGMSQDKQSETFGEYMASLNIVPVSIAYELDPCDALKAAELHAIDAQGNYEKAEHEDVASIATGISGDKGHVHVAFGTPLGAHLETPEQVAAEIDRQVIGNYALHGTNLCAYRALHGEPPEVAGGENVMDGDCSDAAFEARMQAIPEAHRQFALGIYANALVSKLAQRAAAVEATETTPGVDPTPPC